MIIESLTIHRSLIHYLKSKDTQSLNKNNIQAKVNPKVVSIGDFKNLQLFIKISPGFQGSNKIMAAVSLLHCSNVDHFRLTLNANDSQGSEGTSPGKCETKVNHNPALNSF